jgi:heme/copper-type cytochrome/quinol oxidase subunit 2
MKRRKPELRIFCLTALAAVILGSLSSPRLSGAGKLVRIRMTARKYRFDPNIITVKQGDQVELIITAIDRDHGIAIPAFGINQRLKKGVPMRVSFVANKAGTFPFHCSVFCGLGHRRMKGKIIVQGSIAMICLWKQDRAATLICGIPRR